MVKDVSIHGLVNVILFYSQLMKEASLTLSRLLPIIHSLSPTHTCSLTLTHMRSRSLMLTLTRSLWLSHQVTHTVSLILTHSHASSVMSPVVYHVMCHAMWCYVLSCVMWCVMWCATWHNVWCNMTHQMALLITSRNISLHDREGIWVGITQV
jgi:hypothetical protein